MMTLYKIKTAPIVLIEDHANNNVLPLLLELAPEKSNVTIFSYEQAISAWENIFKNNPNVTCYEDFHADLYDKYISTNSTVIIDSVNQMSICLGWNECLKCLKKLIGDIKVERLILILHKDCLSHASKLQLHLNYITGVVISFDRTNPCQIWVKLKKGNKVIKSEEILSYDSKTMTLKSFPIVKEERKEEEPEKPLPSNLSTFKIEVDQIEKIEKYKLKLPYMSKINEGESKVYYEPDAVDDWDEEDPDEDLDI